ncbi:MAG: hypothetical protein K1X65_24060 [Caldilineales bacterium]|nr:hypothetical protein [Caldilineales bacterium]MCW5859102.1 hypothetical protein [Caldilineales bacterium]
MPSSPIPPTTSDVQRIAAIADPVLRNLQITQCYHELAVAMAAQTGAGANWCTVATWASKQAGQSIRKEDLRRTLEELLAGSDETAAVAGELDLGEPGIADGPGIAGGPDFGAAAHLLWQAINPAAAFERTSQAVARGNQKVFEEIGYEFARFLALFEGRQADENRLAAFLQGLRPGDPPDGQDYLRRAFAHYHQALGQMDASPRAELLLLGNLEIGFHEQTRLQPEIVAAMNAPIYDPRQLRGQLLAALFPDPRSRWRLRLAEMVGRSNPVLAARDRLAADFQHQAHLAITGRLMTLHLSRGRVLRLGQDVRAHFPPELRQITLPDLQVLLARVDPTPDSPTGSGAEDWGRLADRMHFITDLFRAYHLDPTLFDPPFAVEQVVALKSGQRPAGLL